jgi:hypothetical protein
MTICRALAAAAAMLAIAILSQAAAMADANGTNRPANGTGAGTLSVDLTTGGFTAEITGLVSTLGRVTVHAEGLEMPVGGAIVGTGAVTITTPNGDKLIGTLTLNTTGQTTTVVITITGGTGRFSDASGTITVICDNGPPSQSGTILTIHLECRVEGQISH